VGRGTAWHHLRHLPDMQSKPHSDDDALPQSAETLHEATGIVVGLVGISVGNGTLVVTIVFGISVGTGGLVGTAVGLSVGEGVGIAGFVGTAVVGLSIGEGVGELCALA